MVTGPDETQTGEAGKGQATSTVETPVTMRRPGYHHKAPVSYATRRRAEGEITVSVYLVERDLPGVSLAQLAALRRVAREACATFTADGKPVAYVRGLFIPGESRCLCLFEAPDAERVRAVNEVAQLPYNRIIMALDLGP